VLPVLHVGGLIVHTYTLIYIIAIVLAALLAYHRVQRLGARQRDVLLATALIFVGGALGALAGPRVIVFLQRLLRPDTAADWGGTSVLGVVGGGMLTALACCLIYRVPVGRAFDLGGLPVPLAQAIGRLGCLAAGCCYGRATDSWLGMYLPDDNHVWQVRYPTQLLSAGVDLLIFIALLAVERYGNARLRASTASPDPPGRTWPFNGFLFLLYAALYCLKRFLIEFLRGDALPPLWGPLNLVQLLCAIVFVTVAGVMAWRWRHSGVAATLTKTSEVL
jgi:phosphatidylglycerol:prolipoprotein diacylglycerol transferase